MTSQTAVFAVPATAELAEVAADALTAVARAAGLRAEHGPGRAGSRLITLEGQLGREAAEEVLPVLLEQALRAATTAARDAVHRGRASAEHLRTYRTAYLAAWGAAAAGLIDRAPEGPVAPPATPAAKAAAAADELGAVLEHARDLRDRSRGGELPAALRLREIRPERDGYYSLEAFVRNDALGAAARLAMITPILPVLRAAADHVEDPAGRGGVHLRLTGRRYSLAAAADLLPALLAHAEPAAAEHDEPAAYLAAFGRAAAARLTAALGSLHGAARDRHQAETGPAAEHADRVPAAVFEQAAAHFGAEPPAPPAPAFTPAPAADEQPHTRSVIAVPGGPARTSAVAAALTPLIEAYGVRVEQVEDRPHGGARHLTVSGPLRLVHAARTDAPTWQDAMSAALDAARPGRAPRRSASEAKTFVSAPERQAARAAYLEAWAQAAAARLRAALARDPGELGEQAAAEAASEEVRAAAARIRAALGQGPDPDRALELVVAPGAVRARNRVDVLELLAGPLGVSVTRPGTVEADMERDEDDRPAVDWHLWRERVRLDGPGALIELLPALATAVLARLEPAAAVAVHARRALDAGPNGRIMRRLALERFVVESARVLARRLRRILNPAAGETAPSDTDGAEQAADRAADLLAPAAAAVSAADQRRSAPVRPERARQVVIVPCGARKLAQPAAAGQLYTGSYHRATRRAADALAAATPGTRVLILSALHGLLELDTVIAPYEQRMGRPGSIGPDRLREQARELGLDGAEVTILAGRAYADAALAVWPGARDLLAGPGGLGRQLARLAQITAEAKTFVSTNPPPTRAPAATSAPAPVARPSRASRRARALASVPGGFAADLLDDEQAAAYTGRSAAAFLADADADADAGTLTASPVDVCGVRHWRRGELAAAA